MEPFDEASPAPRRSARLNPDESSEPLTALKRQDLKDIYPLSNDETHNLMTQMETSEPRNPEKDVWEINSIKGHQNSTSRKSHKELLVTYRCDGKEEWVPYRKVLENKP